MQVPSVWRPLIEDSATLQLCFDFYAATKPPLSNAALECLVSFARPLLHQALLHPGCVLSLRCF